MNKKVLNKIVLIVQLLFIVNISFCTSNQSPDSNIENNFLSTTCEKNSCAAQPLIVIVLMVKNEAHNICKTLEPYVKASIDSYLILDTGSTDKTIEVVQDFFKNNKIKNAYIEEEPFVDFATSRNKALDLARKRFPQAAFLLMIDAEWYINGVENLIEFCKQKVTSFNSGKSKIENVYLCKIKFPNDNLDFYVSRLIKANSTAYFIGKIHETIPFRSVESPQNVFFIYDPSAKGLAASAKRFHRDLKILLEEHTQNPSCSRTVFYLAQTYECLGDLENAFKFYELRSKMTENDEENFIALYRLAQIVHQLSHQRGHNSANESIKYYLEAFSRWPHRAEPLIKIAEQYYSQNNMNLCYLFAKAACEIPYPSNDILFIEKRLYDYDRYDLLGIASWYTSWDPNNKQIGKAAILKALEAEPDNPRLKRNLEFYQG